MTRRVLFAVIVLLGLLAPLTLCAQISYMVPSSGSATATTCDALIYDYGGPNSNYGNSWDGYLVIYPATSGEMISITSGNYNVESSYDYVYVYNGVGTSGTLLATLSGSSSITTPINSSDPSGALTIRFDSDGSVCSYAGFALRVQCMSPMVMSNNPLTTCSTIWTDPGGLGDYSNNLNVTQTICSDNGEAVTVVFNSFSLGSGDILRVYDGSTATGTPMATYTGSTLPPTLTSSGTCLTFNFVSNGSGVSSGWTASIVCVRCSSTGIVSGSPCAEDNIHPFCTDEGQYVYCSSVTGTAADFFGTGSVACLGSTPAPAWYFMRIEHSGNMTIHIEQEDMNGTGIDVDFACWGPFIASSSADFVNKLCNGYYTLHTSYHSSNTTETGYPFGNLTDCSYSAASTENCHILNAQTGEYYLLLITNYEREPGVITFNSVAGSTATTDCSIMAEVSNDGPYCEGDTIHLFCNNPQPGATYQWTGPNGWTSTVVNPVIYPATAAMNGNTYSLVKTLNGVSSAPASTTIEVISVSTSITVSPATATICRGSSVTLAGSSVSGYTNTYSWSPGGQSGQQITVTPTTTTTYSLTQTVAGRCTGHDTVTVTVRQPQHQSYTLDTCASSYSWHGHNANHEGTYNWTWSHQDEYGCTQVDTLHLTISSTSFTQPIDDHNSVPCSWNIQTPTPPTVEVCGNQVPMQLSSTINRINGGCGYFAYVYQYTVAGTPYTWTYYYHLNPSEFSVPSNQDTLVQCLDEAVAPVPPVVINVCGDTIVPESPTVSNHTDGCTGYISYSWLYKDCDNHRKTWTYTYVVADTTRPVFIVPADTFVCRTLEGTFDANPNITGSPRQVTDNCSLLQDLTIVCQDSLHLSIGHGVDTLLRTWTVSDGCDNARIQTQHILIYPPDSAYAWNYICEGEVFDAFGFNFVANHDTIVYQHLQSVHTGCDSVMEVFLTVWHPMPVSDTVESCDSYTWHDSIYTTGGIKTYEHLDANGCKQVDTLHLTLYDSIHVHINDSACYQYTWDGNTYLESGVITRHFVSVHGCDSVVTLHLTIFNKDFVEFTKQVCFGYMWHDHYYDATGDYSLLLTNRYGCDSLVTMHLSIQDTIYEDFDDVACNSYTWNDKIYYSTGDFEQIFHVWEGCDSLVTLHLTLFYDDTVSVDTSACESYIWNDSIYTQTGDYEQHFFTEHGCDSLVKLHLTILHNTRSTLDSAICAADFPFQWNGVTFNIPGGIDSTTIPNSMGCDSLITMHVTMNPNTSSVLYDTIVQNALPYDTLNMHFTAAGSMQTTISNVYGCDSVVTMTLTMLPNILINLDSTVCENDLPVRWNGLDFIQEGTQNLTLIASSRVDSTLSMHLHVNPNTYSTVLDTVIENNLPHTFNGVVFADSVTNARVIIPNAQGCDSVITYSLHVWRNVSSVVDTAVCDDQLPVVWNGVVFTEAGESQVVLTGAHGEDDTLLMRVHVNTSVHTSLQEELCMSDFPYRYVNGQIDTTFQSGTSSLLTVPFTLSTVNGCDSIVTLTLDVMDTSLYIVSSTDFCPNMYTTLSVVTSLEDYVWSTGETTASISVTEPGEYSVTASTGDCRGSAYRRLAPCKVELRLPNAITPSNSDGLNDCFRLPEACLEQIDDFEIKIFSRWGEMVFYSQDKNFKWYGDYKGHIERDAVYSYTIKYIDKDGIMFRMKGAVTVL